MQSNNERYVETMSVERFGVSRSDKKKNTTENLSVKNVLSGKNFLIFYINKINLYIMMMMIFV